MGALVWVSYYVENKRHAIRHFWDANVPLKTEQKRELSPSRRENKKQKIDSDAHMNPMRIASQV